MKKVIMVFVVFIVFTCLFTNNIILNATEKSNKITICVNGVIKGNEYAMLNQNGRLLLPSKTISEYLGASINWSSKQNTLYLKKGKISISIKINESTMIVNRNSINLGAKAVVVSGTIMLPVRAIAQQLGEKVTWNEQSNTLYIGQSIIKPPSINMNKKYIVVIDPGHGGAETGAIYGGVYEKNLNLDIAKRLNELLVKEGITTYMTRKTDKYVGLYERSGLANQVKADILISVHNNADSQSTSGSMVLYYPSDKKTKGGLKAQDLAKITQKNLITKLASRGLGEYERTDLAILRTSNMPAIIAEIGYMSNRNELKKLKSKEYRDASAEALKNSILESLKIIRK